METIDWFSNSSMSYKYYWFEISLSFRQDLKAYRKEIRENTRKIRKTSLQVG